MLAAAGCARDEGAVPEPKAAVATAAERPVAAAGEQALPRVLFLGDSLTAGFGLSEAEAFPALIDDALRERGWDVDVVNGGVSGDTTAGGLSRLPWLLRQSPDIVVVELGANDGLRGLPLAGTAENLGKIVRAAHDAGAEVLLVGMRLPPNYGATYAQDFEAVFNRIAAELEVVYMPFLLEDVGGVAELNLPDGIHPNADGHRIVASNLLPFVEQLLERLESGAAA